MSEPPCRDDPFVAEMRKCAEKVKTHEHPQGSDIYCLNLVAYMGERMDGMIRRLDAAQAEAAAGHNCNACPDDVRNLIAVAHNLLIKLYACDWIEVGYWAGALNEALAKLQPVTDAHFEALNQGASV